MMVGTPEDFGQLYRDALAERNHERKQLLLRRVQEALDIYSQVDEVQLQLRPVVAEHGKTAVETRITRGGGCERSLPSVA